MTANTSFQTVRIDGGLRFIGNCLFCNEEFEAKKRNRRYCCNTCRVLFGRQKRQGQEPNYFKENKIVELSDFDKFIIEISANIKQAAREKNYLKVDTLQRQKELFIKQNQEAK